MSQGADGIKKSGTFLNLLSSSRVLSWSSIVWCPLRFKDCTRGQGHTFYQEKVGGVGQPPQKTRSTVFLSLLEIKPCVRPQTPKSHRCPPHNSYSLNRVPTFVSVDVTVRILETLVFLHFLSSPSAGASCFSN